MNKTKNLMGPYIILFSFIALVKIKVDVEFVYYTF